MKCQICKFSGNQLQHLYITKDKRYIFSMTKATLFTIDQACEIMRKPDFCSWSRPYGTAFVQEEGNVHFCPVTRSGKKRIKVINFGGNCVNLSNGKSIEGTWDEDLLNRLIESHWYFRNVKDFLNLMEISELDKKTKEAFNWRQFISDAKLAVHCKTEKEAKTFCRLMYIHHLAWSYGGSFLYDISYEGPETCYEKNHGGNTRDYYEKNGYHILEFADFFEEVIE